MEKMLICSLTIAKPLTTIRVAAAKERLGATTVRRMLNQKGIQVFKKATGFLITKQNGARRKICCGDSEGDFEIRFEAHNVNG